MSPVVTRWHCGCAGVWSCGPRCGVKPIATGESYRQIKLIGRMAPAIGLGRQEPHSSASFGGCEGEVAGGGLYIAQSNRPAQMMTPVMRRSMRQ